MRPHAALTEQDTAVGRAHAELLAMADPTRVMPKHIPSPAGSASDDAALAALPLASFPS